ncbi:MAG: PEP-CTERM sorting domain-containing protein [Terriglobia bacterium]
MKKAILLTVMIFTLSAFAVSDPCTNTELQAYLNLKNGCTVGNLLFTDFFVPTPSSVGAVLPTPSQVGVSPVNLSSGSGLVFDVALGAGPGQMADFTIDYLVKVEAGGAITGSSLSIDAGTSGSGLVAVAETQCLGGMLPACTSGTSIGLSTTGTQLTDSASFGGVTEVGASKDILVTDPGATGQAVISSETQLYSTDSTVPEPASLTLFGTGLLLLAFVIRRRHSFARL